MAIGTPSSHICTGELEVTVDSHICTGELEVTVDPVMCVPSGGTLGVHW